MSTQTSRYVLPMHHTLKHFRLINGNARLFDVVKAVLRHKYTTKK